MAIQVINLKFYDKTGDDPVKGLWVLTNFKFNSTKNSINFFGQTCFKNAKSNGN